MLKRLRKWFLSNLLYIFILSPFVNSINVQFYQFKNSTGLVYSSSSTARCNNVPENNGNAFIYSIKTDVCIMVYTNPNCQSWSRKFDRDNSLDWQWHVKSYHVCNDDVGGYKLNVDITKYNDLWSTQSDNPDVLECYSNVCDCVNVPKYVQEMPKWSLNNHGNNLIAYYESDCSKRMWEPKYIPAGQSSDTMYMANHQMSSDASNAIYKIQSLGPDPNSTYFKMSCEDSFNYNWIMQLELLETWQDLDAMQQNDSPDMNDPSIVLAQTNNYRIVFFENENFLGTHFESNLTESCKSLPRKTTENNARGLQNEVKSVKTDICVMLFSDNECMSRSVKIKPGGSSNLTRIWEFTVTGEQTLDLLYDMFPNWKWVTGSFHACTEEEGSSQQLTVDLTSYYSADKEPKANQPAPAIYSRYINVCSCQNIPYQIQLMDKYSIENHGNSLIAYFQHDCLVTKFDPLWIPAGRSSYSIGFGSFTKIEKEGMAVVQKIQSIGPDPNAEYYQNNCVNYEDSDSNMKGLIGDMNTKLQVQNLGNVDVVMGIGGQSNPKSTTKSTPNMENFNNQMSNKPTSTNNQMLLPPNSNNPMLQQTANSNIQFVQQSPNGNNQMLEARDLNNQMPQKVPSTNIEISQQTPNANIQISQQTPNNQMLLNPPNNVPIFRPPPNSNQLYPQISRYNKVYSPLPKTKITPKPSPNQNAINMANQQYRKSNQMFTEQTNNGTQILMQQSTKDNKIVVESTKDDKQMVVQMAVNNNQGNVPGQQPANGNQILMQSTPIANTIFNQPANQGFGRRFESPVVQPVSPPVDMGGQDTTGSLQQNQMSMMATPNNGLQVLIQPVKENQAAMQTMDGNKMPLQPLNGNRMETQPNYGNQILSTQSQASNISVNMSSQPSDMGIQMSMQPLSNGNQISGQPFNMQSQMYAPPSNSRTLMMAHAITRNQMHGKSSDGPTTDTPPIEENAPPELQMDNQKDTGVTHIHNQLLPQQYQNGNQMVGQTSLQDKQTILNPSNNNNQMQVQPASDGDQGLLQPSSEGGEMVGNTDNGPTTNTPPIEENAPPEIQIDNQKDTAATHTHNQILTQQSQNGNPIGKANTLQDKQTIMNPSNNNNQMLVQPSSKSGQMRGNTYNGPTTNTPPIEENAPPEIQIDNQKDTGETHTHNQLLTQQSQNDNQMVGQTSVQDEQTILNPSNYNNQILMQLTTNDDQGLSQPVFNGDKMVGSTYNGPSTDTPPIEENAPPEIQIDNQKDTEMTHTHNQLLTQPSSNSNQLAGQASLQDKQTIMNPSNNNNQMLAQPTQKGNQGLKQPFFTGRNMVGNIYSNPTTKTPPIEENAPPEMQIDSQANNGATHIHNTLLMQPSQSGDQTQGQTSLQDKQTIMNPSNNNNQMSSQVIGYGNQVLMQQSNDGNQITMQPSNTGNQMYNTQLTFSNNTMFEQTSLQDQPEFMNPSRNSNSMATQSSNDANQVPEQSSNDPTTDTSPIEENAPPEIQIDNQKDTGVTHTHNQILTQPSQNRNQMVGQTSLQDKQTIMNPSNNNNQMLVQPTKNGDQGSSKSLSKGDQLVGNTYNGPTTNTPPIEENAPPEMQIDNQKDTEVTHTHNQMLTQPSQNANPRVGQTSLQDKQTIMNPSNNYNQLSTQPGGYVNQMLMQQSNMGNQMPMQQTGMQYPTQSSNISVNMSSEPSNMGIQMSVQPSNNKTLVPMQAFNVNTQMPVQSSINGKGMIMEVTLNDGKVLNDTSDKYKKKPRQPFKLTSQMRIQSAKTARNQNRPPPQKRGNWVKLQPPSIGNVKTTQSSKMGNQVPMQSPNMGNQMSIQSTDGKEIIMEVSVKNGKGSIDSPNKNNQMPSNAANQMQIQQLDSKKHVLTKPNTYNQIQSNVNGMTQQSPNNTNLTRSDLPSKVTQLEQQVQQLKQNQDQDEEFEGMAAKIKASLQELA